MPRDHPAEQQYKTTRNSGALQVVGSFYEAIARQMTRGKTPNDPKEGDLFFRGKDGASFGGDAKGGGYTHPFRLRWGQLLRYKELSQGFPYDGFLYFLFSYSCRSSTGPRGQQVRQDLIRNAVLRGKGEQFLAGMTRRVWIVPLQLIELLRGDKELSLSLPFNEEDGRELRPTVDIGRKTLRELALTPPDSLPLSLQVLRGKAELVLKVPNKKGRILELPTSFSVVYFRHESLPEIKLRHVQWHP